MTLCIGFIGLVIVLEAGPVYNVFMTGILGFNPTPLQWIWLAASFSVVLFLFGVAVVIPMRMGEKKISQDEILLGQYALTRNHPK